LENLVRGRAVSQADASSTHDVELATNDLSESRPTTSETTQERHELTSENISLQQIEGTTTTSGFENGSPIVAEVFCGSHSQAESQVDLEQNRRDWQQFSHAVIGEESERSWHENADISSREGTTIEHDRDDHLREANEESTSVGRLPEAHEESVSDDSLPEAHEEQHDSDHLPEVPEELHDDNHLQESHGEWSRDNHPIEVYDEWQSDDHLPEVNEEWQDDDDSNDTADNWHDNTSDQPIDHDAALIRRGNTFIPGDDDNVYSTELRELLSR
jgi:hypothetical protein